MGKAAELKTASNIIIDILKKFPEARNSDDCLYILVCRSINSNVSTKPFDEVLINRNKYGLPAFETVRRSRQKLQAMYPELRACADVEAMREVNEEVFREYAIQR